MLHILAANADGGDRHAADGGQHEGRADYHDERMGKVHRAKAVCAHTVTDKDAVDDGEQEKGALAQNRGKDIFQDQLCSGLFHSGLFSFTGFSYSFRMVKFR